MPKVAFFLGNNFLGHGEAVESVRRWHNVSFFCPECGQLWGRVFVPSEQREWQVLPARCAAHPSGWSCEVAGSFFHFQSSGHWIGRLTSYPPKALAHEFAVHFAHAERFPQDSATGAKEPT